MMDRFALAARIEGVVGEYLKNKGIEFVELMHRYEGRDLILRFLVDKPEGSITIQECAQLNFGIGRMLDEADFLGTRYVLEVSSPGLDRPLTTKKDFTRCIDKPVYFFLNEPVNEKMECAGVIRRVENDSVYVDIEGILCAIPLAQINKGKQVIF